MSHEFESGMFYKEPAWHGLGTVLEHKVYSSEEALRLAGADWTVSLESMVTDRDGIEVPNHKAVIRDDTKAVLGVVGSKYTPLQNLEAFKFFDPFLHERDCFISTCGVLAKGRRVWVAAEIEGLNTEVVEGDRLRNYLLLANSHDGSLKLTTKFVVERVVCANTLKAALGESGEFKSLSHTASVKAELDKIKSTVDIIKRSFEDTTNTYRQLAATNLSTEQFRGYLEGLFEKELKTTSDRLERTATLEDVRATKKIMNFYETTPDLQMDGVRGTAYSAFNSVSQFLCHKKSSNTDSRYDSIWFGEDSKFLQKAEQAALALV